MVLFFSGLILIAGAVLGLTIYRASTGLVENSLGLQAQAVAERAAKLIDTDEFAKLNAESGETPYYAKLREQLNAMRETNGMKFLYTLAKTSKDGQDVYYYVVDGAPQDVNPDDFSPLGEPEDNAYPGMIKTFASGQAQVGELTQDEYGATVTAYVPITDKAGKLIGVVGGDLDSTAVYALMQSNRTTMLWVSLLIFVVSVLLVFALARFLVQPLRKLTAQVAKVRSGDMTVRVGMARKDEIGALAAAFEQLIADTAVFIKAIRSGSDRLSSASAGVTEHARHTTDASHAIAASIRDASQGADTQVLRAADTTRAMEEMTLGMQRIAEYASVVAEVSQETTDEAQRGNESIVTAVSRMEAIYASSAQMAAATKHLEGRSGEIGEITMLMAGIASQTNLLALNAAIEAARAGENGRGFAVVADEVRKLANQSQVSSQRISELIEAILVQTAELSASMEVSAGEVQTGLGIVKEAGTAFGSIMQGLERMNQQVQEVSSASQEISAGSEEVAASVDEMEKISRQAAQHFQGVAARSEAQLSAMDEVSGSATSLRAMSEELKQLVSRFKV